jgi:hypothetical protein
MVIGHFDIATAGKQAEGHYIQVSNGITLADDIWIRKIKNH